MADGPETAQRAIGTSSVAMNGLQTQGRAPRMRWCVGRGTLA